MSTNKFLSFINGVATLFTAITASGGATDANKIIATNGAGVIDITFMPQGIGDPVRTILASENLAAGDFVNIFNNAGTPNIRKADASNGRAAHGFVLTAVTTGQSGSVYLRGLNTAVTGFTPGANIFLSGTTAGTGTSAAPTATGFICQNLGVAVSATAIPFEYDNYIQL